MSRRRIATSLVSLFAAAIAAPASAVIGTVDAVPAATLLLPYFEVEPAANLQESAASPGLGSGVNTTFQIRNADDEPRLVRVTLWTDYGVPTRGFDVYLTGRDSQDIDLRLVLAGVLPTTGTSITPLGNNAGAPVVFPGCPTVLHPDRLPEAEYQALRAAHRGQPSGLFGDRCVASHRGDGLARGYVTVDVVARCADLHPTDAAYFAEDATRVAAEDNVLFGEYSIVDFANNYAFGERLVPIEADRTAAATDGADDYTFYGGLVGYSGRDHREPLATRFHARHASGGAFSGGTDLLVWRDPRTAVTLAGTPGASCSAPPAPWPARAREIVLFDEQSSALESDPATAPFGLATQRVAVGPATGLYTPFVFGRLHLNLNDPLGTGAPGIAPVRPDRRQAWVTVVMQATGRFQTGHAAVQLDGAADADDAQIAASLPIAVPPAAASAKGVTAKGAATKADDGRNRPRRAGGEARR